jgi:hypothetical protein
MEKEREVAKSPKHTHTRAKEHKGEERKQDILEGWKNNWA